MISKNVLVIISIILFLIILLMFNGNIGNDNSLLIKELKNNNQKLVNQYDSVISINKSITQTLNGYQDKIDSLETADQNLQKLYNENNIKYKKLQEGKKSVIARIDTMGSNDIKKYFSKFEW